MRENRHFSSQAFRNAEETCRNDDELSYVFHVEAMILFYRGDVHSAIERAKKCLDLSSRVGQKKLEAETLLHLGKIYEALGHRDLGTAYAQAAWAMDSDNSA
jgi:hypothetical protein